MKRRKLSTALLSFLIIALTATGILAAAAYGTEEDPLVAASYIEEVVIPDLEDDIDDAIADKEEELRNEIEDRLSELSAGGVFSDELVEEVAQRASELAVSGTVSSWNVIKVPSGKTLVGEVGCQIMLRLGGASCVSSGSTGLINMSDGTVLGSGGALKTNNLYMATIAGRGFKAVGDATVLVRGGYTIK
ncbi:MAG: hypothetical protein IIW34_03630 [Clostridia bacterium]|nr:hypothetical protein [Clostridia bacterium]